MKLGEFYFQPFIRYKLLSTQTIPSLVLDQFQSYTNLAFHEGHFSHAFTLLQEHKCSYWLYKLQFKIIEMMVAFELTFRGKYKLKAMDKLADAFRKYIQRNEGKYQFRWESYHAFIKFTHDLIKAKMSDHVFDQQLKGQFRERLGNIPKIHRRIWLAQKVES